jgi:hypothetical protein
VALFEAVATPQDFEAVFGVPKASVEVGPWCLCIDANALYSVKTQQMQHPKILRILKALSVGGPHGAQIKKAPCDVGESLKTRGVKCGYAAINDRHRCIWFHSDAWPNTIKVYSLYGHFKDAGAQPYHMTDTMACPPCSLGREAEGQPEPGMTDEEIRKLIQTNPDLLNRILGVVPDLFSGPNWMRKAVETYRRMQGVPLPPRR